MAHLNFTLKVLFISFIVCITISAQTNSAAIIKNEGEQKMKRVTGIGGIFFKSKNPDTLRAWYKKHLGIQIEAWGGFAFQWRNENNPTGDGMTVWNIFNSDTKYFEPSNSSFMINYRVENLNELLNVLRSEGCQVDPKIEDSEFGKFGWVMDPDGNRIELWQPPEGQ
jgi:predicted enzyme related to lactoylglutathione lyase